MKAPLTLDPLKRPSTTLLAGGAMERAAIHSQAERVTPALDSAHSADAANGYDFSRVQSQSACPAAPTRCPFGGACHTCPLPVQAKLATDQPGDQYEKEYEKEAARVADTVEHGSGMPLLRSATTKVQPTTVPPIVHEVLRDSGRPLDNDTRAFMESRFGHNFGRVRVHTDALAAKSAQAVNALAYTVRSDLVFGAGQYRPQTPQGQQLISHELTHVIQQSKAAAQSGPLSIGPANDVYERQAGQAAQTLARAGIGHTARSAGGPPVLQRQSGGAPVHTAPTGGEHQSAYSRFPADKWSEVIEHQYRRRGDTLRANAIRNCRIQGGTACARLLTPRDVDRLHALARSSGGDRQKILAGLAMMTPTLIPSTPPGLPPGLFPPPPVAPLPPVAPPVVTPPVVTPVPPVAPGPAAGAGIGAGATVAGVAAIAAVLVIAGLQLWELGRFQEELRSRGFIILEDSLGLCIGGCHLPARPQPQPGPRPIPAPAPNQPTRRRRRRRPNAYPLCWAAQLGPPMLFGVGVPSFVRTPNVERDTEDAQQRRLQLIYRQRVDPHFVARDYHVHHSVPLFLGGLDGAAGNLVTLPGRLHLRGHAVLRQQPQMLTPPPPLPPLPADLYSHPAGTAYELVGYKWNAGETCGLGG